MAIIRTYGTCLLKKDGWEIEAEPQVLMRLRRHFPRVQNEFGVITMKDTEEVCFELRWFMERYPLQVDELDYLEDRADAHEQNMRDFHLILSGKSDPRAFEMALPPREYQQVAADLWLRMGSLLLADDVGLGKTCSSICGLTEPITRPALIVTLTHLPSQWQEEIEKFAPSLKTHIIRKGTVYDIVNFGKRKKRVGAQLQLLNDVDAGDFPDVLICNYHKLHGWAESLSGVIKSVIYDECQELRHPGSKKHNAAKLISEKCDFRLGLSATPIYNYGGEIFHVMEAVNPGALGSRDEFLKEWCYNLGGFSGDKHAINDPQAFGKYMRDQALMLRRTRADVKRELPPISNIPHTVDVDSRIIDNVADDAMALARLILGEGGKGIDKMEASQELSWKLRQATGIAKAPYVAEFVKMLLEQGEQVLVYAWHREVYAILQERLKEYNPRLFTGSESPAKKKAAAQSFKDGNCKVMLMSLRSGAGLDGLQHVCNTVVYAELDWSPGVHEQATGRIARDGQTNPVFAYYLTSETGSDPVVSEALGLKRQQVEGLRTPDGDLIEELQTDGKNIKRLAEAFIKQRKGK